MIYVDTSVLVALIGPEPHSAAVARWYGRARAELASGAWCVTQFASALGIEQHTSQRDDSQAREAWRRFGQLTANDLVLLPWAVASSQHGSAFALDATIGRRAEGALHLACAARAGAESKAAFDGMLARNARRLNLERVTFQ